MVDSVFYTDEVVTVLHNQYQGVGQPLLFLLHGLNTDSNNFSKPAQFVVLASLTSLARYHMFKYLHILISLVFR